MSAIEVTQDAACIIEKSNASIDGVFTKGIQSCLVTIYETESALILIHDSGQLHQKSIDRITTSHGEIKKITAAYGIGVNDINRERANKIRTMNQSIFMEQIINHPVFSMFLDIKKLKLQSYPDNSVPDGVTEISGRNKRQVIVELNNCFLPTNSQSLLVDVQYKDGKYQKIKKLKLDLKKMLKISREQKNHFFMNLGFLLKGHEENLYCLPSNILKIAEKYQVLRYTDTVIGEAEYAKQDQAYRECFK